jgi:RES domain-containing protein
MPRRVYRVCRARYARLDGEGAKRVGGRWNSPGRAVVYMAQSIALAVLENLVHMSRQDFPQGYVCVAADLPDNLPTLSEQELRHRYELEELNPKALGDWWIRSKASAALIVPSTVVIGEANYLLNPAHRDFSKIAIEPPAIFHFDPRLFS